MARGTEVDRGRALLDGAIAGAVGSTALNGVTYLDMALRGRPASSTPERTAGKLAALAHLGLGPEDRAANRRSGLGPLFGYVIGVGVAAAGAAVLGRPRLPTPIGATLLGAGLMLLSDGSMTVLRVTNPRQWSRTDWISDIIPHLIYGAVAVATWHRLVQRSKH
ncbi:hypothetical protein ACWDV4_09650 [Micromonospora sp. NPDC003197]